MTPTLRRLNDRERYWGLTWPGWAAAAAAAGSLYGAVRLSPLGVRATVTVVLLTGAFCVMVALGVSGQALSPVRQLAAVVAYRLSPKRYLLTQSPARGGLVLNHPPAHNATADGEGAGEVLGC